LNTSPATGSDIALTALEQPDFSADGKVEDVTSGTEKCEVLDAQNCKQVTLSLRISD
jgi:hypothetical protein